MRIAYFCFIVAATAALGGMSLGIRMGMAQDFTLAPVHAHLNLLGWVTMALYGLYYRAANSRSSWLAWTQVGAAALGFPMMTGGLAVVLSSGSSFAAPLIVAAAEPVLIGGSMLTIASMALFLAVLVIDAVRSVSGRMPELRPAV